MAGPRLVPPRGFTTTVKCFACGIVEESALGGSIDSNPDGAQLALYCPHAAEIDKSTPLGNARLGVPMKA
jgi:hypothetical protein